MLSDGQVLTTIAGLRAYKNKELSIDGDLMAVLEEAIEQAFDALCGPIDCDIDDDPPLTASW